MLYISILSNREVEKIIYTIRLDLFIFYMLVSNFQVDQANDSSIKLVGNSSECDCEKPTEKKNVTAKNAAKRKDADN